MANERKIALLGQPNSGKSTVFNTLTGAHQHVGNWPGKTVEKVEGEFTLNGVKYLVADLPGTYSLSANSDEEIVTRDYIASGGAAAVGLPGHGSRKIAPALRRAISARMVSSAAALVTASCTPVAMFLSAQTCCAISSSPRKITNGMPSLSA